MKKRHTLMVALSIITLTLAFFGLQAADSRNFPVTALYCDNSSLQIHPFSFVKPDGESAFNCYEVQVTAIADGYRYSFEDAGDFDYNDLVVELWTSGNGTGSPVARVRYVSSDAGYSHKLHLVYGGSEIFVFDARQSSPGEVFDIALPARECPGFELGISPESVSISAGETATFNVTVTSRGGFSDPVTLSVDGLPAGVTALFSPNPVIPGNSSLLTISSSSSAAAGTYQLTLKGSGGKDNAFKNFQIEIKSCPDFNVTIEATPLSGPAPLTVTFDALTASDTQQQFSYLWNFGDGSVSTEKSPLHTYATAGNYQARLETLNECGLKRAANLTINVTGSSGTILKSFSQNDAFPGTELQIAISVRNDGPSDWKEFTVTDELSPWLQYIGDDAPVQALVQGQKLKWEFRALKRGNSRNFNIRVRVAAEAPQATIANVAWLRIEAGSPVASNTALLTVNKVSLAIEKSVDKQQARPLEELRYRIKLSNLSAIAISEIQLSDVLAPELEFLSQQGKLAFIREGNRLLWSGAVSAGEIIELNFSARISARTISGTKIANNALVRDPAGALEAASNTVFTTIASDPLPHSRILFSKRADTPQSDIGKIINFRITLENNSSYQSLLMPALEDYLPQGFSYLPGTTLLNGIKYHDPTGQRRLLWDLPPIEPGRSVTLRYQTLIGTDASRGKNVNTARLRASDSSGETVSLEARAFVNVAASGLIFYCGVQGTVFLDRDRNEFFSLDDTPLSGIEVRLSSGQKSYTDSMGRYSFENLFPGDYVVGINSAALPEKYRLASTLPRVVTLADGLSDVADFAVFFQGEDDVGTSRLEGRVFFDKNRDRVFNGDDPLCSAFRVTLDGKDSTTGSDGRFVFTHLPPGPHTIEISYSNGTKSVTETVTLAKGDNTVEIPLRFTGIEIKIRGER